MKLLLITLVASAAADCVLKPGSHLVSGASGELTCEKCPVHTYGVRDTSATDPQQMFKCIPCGPGTYALQRGSVECTQNQCPANTMRVADSTGQNGGDVCVPCPADSVKDSTGQCFCKAGSQLVNGTCEKCPRQTYQDKDKSDHCKPCPAGKVAFNTGSTSCKTNTCAAGKYAFSQSSYSGALYCRPCAAMTFSEAGATKCTPCKRGGWSKGLQSSFYSGQGASQCQKSTCKAGTSTVVHDVHMPQKSGTYQDGDCVKCSIGWYSDLDGAMDCKQCPAGSTTSHDGAKSLGACHRNNCPAGTRSVQGECKPCPKGTYQDSDGATTCKPCAAGTYSFSTGATACASTSTCDKGYYQDPTNANNCIQCAVGTYSDVKGARSCKKCPDNMWTWNKGSKECTGVACDVGKYKPSKSQGCKACAPGTFQTRMNQARCDDCPYGKWQFSSSQNACVSNPCPAGTKMVNNQGKCTQCGVNEISRAGAVTCSQCPTGKFRRASQTDCVPSTCKAGTYETGTECKPCDANTFAPANGATACKPCADGLGTDGKKGQSACWQAKQDLNTNAQDVGYHVCSGAGKLLGCQWKKTSTKTTGGDLPTGSNGQHYSLRITHHDSNNGGQQFDGALMSHKCGVVTTSSGAQCKCWCWSKRHATDAEAQGHHTASHDGANGKLTNPTAFRTMNYNNGNSPQQADKFGGRSGKNNVGYSSNYDAAMSGTQGGVNNDRFDTFEGNSNNQPVDNRGRLYISEYVEGSHWNKAIELTNPTGSAMSLDGVVVQWHHNGKVYDSSDNYDVPLTGKTIAAGGTFVLCRDENKNDSQQVPADKCDMQFCYSTKSCAGKSIATNAVLHTGDDAVELLVDGKTTDVIGEVGTDPGSCWKDAQNRCMTKDKTIRRKISVATGNTVWTSSEWDIFSKNDVSGLGQ